MAEALQVAELRDQGGGGHQADPAQRSQGLDQQTVRAGCSRQDQLRLQPRQLLLGLDQRLLILQQHDLVRRVWRPQRGQPGTVGLPPGAPPGGRTHIQAQQEHRQPVPVPQPIGPRGAMRVDPIPQRLMRRVQHPHRGEIAGPS